MKHPSIVKSTGFVALLVALFLVFLVAAQS
jgi:hypothetical protein